MSNWAATLEFIYTRKHLFLNEFDRQVKNLTLARSSSGAETEDSPQLKDVSPQPKEVSQRKHEFINLLDYLIEGRNGAGYSAFSSQELPPEPSEVRIWLRIILAVLHAHGWHENSKEPENIKEHENMVQRLIEAVYLYAWKRQEEMLQKRFQLQEQKLMAGIVAAQENERKRLARDIHDEVIQLLASSIVRLQIVQHSGIGSEEQSQSLKDLYFELREIEHLIREAVQAYRLVSVDMDSFWLTQAGFFPTLRAYLRSYESKTGIKTNLKIEGEENGLERTVGITIFRVIQEGLQNVRKHSRASAATVELGVNAHDIMLTLSDNGQGFDPNQVKAQDFRTVSCLTYFGLFSMEQRVKLLGGVFAIHSEPGVGTVIKVQAPSQGATLPESKQVKRGSPWIKSKY
ncbi:sensor histidine kinase [Paradesulfitobacterium ferrireducens]|uniref:sensor histidine kinase n=1 Tax=Paradesulfitobacterium ferrireducens TaxID=2816476 RepID=UPI001A8DE365|nr:sensor histidine kinase [Paradesulfitobacterium ferrireducens]